MCRSDKHYLEGLITPLSRREIRRQKAKPGFFIRGKQRMCVFPVEPDTARGIESERCLGNSHSDSGVGVVEGRNYYLGG